MESTPAETLAPAPVRIARSRRRVSRSSATQPSSRARRSTPKPRAPSSRPRWTARWRSYLARPRPPRTARSSAPPRTPTPPNPPPAETEVGALLAAVRQLQATLLAESHARAVEARTLAQRLAQLEQGQSGPSTVAAPREVGFTRSDRDVARSEIASRLGLVGVESARTNVARFAAETRPPTARRISTQRSRLSATPPMSIPMPSTYIAPAPRPPPIPTADPRADAYSYPFLEKLRVAEPIPTAQRNPERVTEPATHLAVPAHSQDAGALDWDAADRETLLKAASRPRYIESSGVKIRSFLADAELFLTLCNRPRSRWAYFVLSWLGSEEAEKVRRSHVADSVADYEKFRDGLTTIFGRFEFEGAFRAQLRSLRQSGAETVTAYAARTTDLCSRAYAEFATEAQLSLAVDHFIGGLADTSTREYLLRERARRPLEWIEAVRIAQASETARLSNAPLGAAAACDSSAIVASAIAAPLSEVRDTPHGNVSQSRAQTESCAQSRAQFWQPARLRHRNRMFENNR